MGLWHDIESYPEAFQDGTCNNAFYTLIDGVVDVFNTQVIGQTLDTIRGTAVITSTDGSAKLEATFNIMGINGKTNLLKRNYPIFHSYGNKNNNTYKPIYFCFSFLHILGVSYRLCFILLRLLV